MSANPMRETIWRGSDLAPLRHPVHKDGVHAERHRLLRKLHIEAVHMGELTLECSVLGIKIQVGAFVLGELPLREG